MIVSTEWLTDYVRLPDSTDDLTERLTLSGLNLEGIETVGQDTAIDLEVTSNRPDCLGHVGVAREIAVLYGQELKMPPAPELPESASPPASVEVRAAELCPRYTARVIRGVKIGPSPDWLKRRLETLGIAVINNVVDATNYVMMECGQPLHAFDLDRLAGGRIIVREAAAGEKFVAINHHEYELQAGTCVIADADRAVALAGVMGGADTEVAEQTINVLLESADFAPLSVRNTARRLSLHSPSSYRFERGVDPEGIDWASRRCAALIVELAGGKIVEGVADVSSGDVQRPEIKLRFDQPKRILGIEVDREEVRSILSALGCEETHLCDRCLKTIPPSWRADLNREIDLIEEIARIHGYDAIPEDAGVKMATSSRSRSDQVLEKVRGVLTGAGFHEAMTLSAVEPEAVGVFRPWSASPPLRTATPVLRGADALRQSVVPSLLAARQFNEKVSNPVIELFEIAKVYLPGRSKLPEEKLVLALTSGAGYLALKGVVEALLETLHSSTTLVCEPLEGIGLLDAARSTRLSAGGQTLGVLGDLSPAGLEEAGLRRPAAVAELDVAPLLELAELVPTAAALSPYPPMGRDLNIVVDDAVRWSQVESVVRESGGELIESIVFQDVYRDPERLGAGKKSLLFSLQLRAADQTLTNEEADALRERVVAAVGKQLGGQLRS